MLIKALFIFASIVIIHADTEIPVAQDSFANKNEPLKTDDGDFYNEVENLNFLVDSPKESFTYQADVNKMMKIIINSLYQNKEIFLRELISNAADALDKIRFLSLADPNLLNDNQDLKIMIKADKKNHILHIIDTGIGMTRNDLINNLGTIAKSGTNEFLKQVAEGKLETNDLIGQFGVGFYSTFLVADKVVVISKHNDDDQFIWESDSENFSVLPTKANTLGRGTQISLHLKEEAQDFLEDNTLKDLIRKYSQFINFPIYLYEKSVKQIEDPEESVKEVSKDEDTKSKDEDEDAKVEEVKEDDETGKKEKKMVEKTVWDYTLMNGAKPIWTRKTSEVSENEYYEFYKAISKDSQDPLTYIHFTAEGEVTFKAILFIGKTAPPNMFHDYGKKVDHIKLYVRRVFITSDFEDMMPKYLSFVVGIVDSDDLPLNVSRETLQQSKLLKVIKKKLIRKVLDMIKKLNEEEFKKFWKEFSTNIKLGIVEDTSNRNRLAKLVRFYSSFNETEPTSLTAYVERMKDKQENIYFVAGQTISEVKNSPFVERLLKKGYEVLYLVESIDEYAIQALPDFEGKKFMNIAKEGLKLDDGKKSEKNIKKLEKQFEPLTTWFKENPLKDKIEKSIVSQRLAESPCALIASTYGWSANMERLMKSSAYAKTNDPLSEYYANMKKTLEINPRHPLIKELLRRVEEDKEDQLAKDMAVVLYETATLRSGYALTDSKGYSDRVERIMKMSFNIPDTSIDVEEDVLEVDDGEDEDESPEVDNETYPKEDEDKPIIIDEDEPEDKHIKEEVKEEL